MEGKDLAAWQRRCGLRTQADAAKVLRLAVATYRGKLKGRSPVGGQTELLAAYYEVYGRQWLTVAEAAHRLASLTSLPIAPIAARRALEILDRVMNPGALGHR